MAFSEALAERMLEGWIDRAVKFVKALPAK
jgi:hypothetical protein